jgi:AhpD family alkylhydroperoxidase
MPQPVFVLPDAMKAMFALDKAADADGLPTVTKKLVHLRASQINGCGLCVDMHIKQATIHGERALRLHHLAIWRESALFAPRERACLAWTEVLTKIPEHGVPDEVYERVRTELSEKEISDLTFIVMSINAWNRANVAFKTVPGAFDAAFGLDKAHLN